MEVVLISVPYTGTNFTAGLFTDLGFSRAAMNERPRGDTVYVAHALKDSQVCPALGKAEKMPLVIPLRHPFRCEESYRRKGIDIAQMILGYENLMRFLHLEPHFMPVDSGHREKYLKLLKDKLGLPFKTNWGVVASKSGTSDIPFGELEPSQPVIDLVGRHKTFFESFYD